MTTTPHPPSTDAIATGATRFLAADVGGTHVRIGLVAPAAAGGGAVEVLEYRKYVCAEHAGLAAILSDFLASLADAGGVSAAVIASAGYALDDGSVITANLPWRISLPEIRDRLGLERLHLVNDFEAVAHAASGVGASEVLQLSGPAEAAPGPSLVVGPGTGLGAAVRIPHGDHAVVLATEAGQAALTVGNEREMAVLRELLRERAHVPVEHALSGPGLMNLYAALAAIEGVPGQGHASPGAITAAARDGSDPLARESLDMFCGLLGSTIGDMALLYGAHGGVHLAGGILPQIRDVLVRSSFVERYLNKGPMREALERIPVRLIEHGQLGVVGAAQWYLARHRHPG